MGQKLAVLGGGISGLSLAYYLKKFNQEDEITVFEKSPRVGGVIDACVMDNLVFDKGPKTIRKSTGQDLLEMLGELGLMDDLITASLKTKNRYIFYKNSLQKLPTCVFEFLVSPLTRSSFFSLIKELFFPVSKLEDVSIGDFARRHFGASLADCVFEPFVRGVCGSDMDILSLRSCFPRLFELERQYGSIIKGMIKTRQKSDKTLFNLKGGFVSLVDALVNLGSFEVKCHQNVKKLKCQNGKALVCTEKETFIVDKIFSTLPLNVMQPLLQTINCHKHEIFNHIGYESLVGVSCAFEKDVLQKKGFGYLVPLQEKQPVFGAIFDSCIFPDLDQSQFTKMTFLMPNYSKTKAIEITKKMLKEHLNIEQKPSYMRVFNYDKALTCYPVGFHKLLEDWTSDLKIKAPWLECCGNYRHPPGVNYCISFSKQLAKDYGALE